MKIRRRRRKEGKKTDIREEERKRRERDEESEKCKVQKKEITKRNYFLEKSKNLWNNEKIIKA